MIEGMMVRDGETWPFEGVVPRWVSSAQFSFEAEAKPQLEQLLKIHETIGGSGPGRRYNLEVINKSAIVLICAFWESFVEDLAAEALRHLANSTNVDRLPVLLRKSLTKDLIHDKNELAIWRIAGDGWHDVLLQRAERISNGEDRTLSTPSSRNVEDFFRTQVGVEGVTTSWRWSKVTSSLSCSRLDQFIRLRNAIAHRGGPSDVAVLKKDAVNGLDLIDRLAKLSLKYVDKEMERMAGAKLVPEWNSSIPDA